MFRMWREHFLNRLDVKQTLKNEQGLKKKKKKKNFIRTLNKYNEKKNKFGEQIK